MHSKKRIIFLDFSKAFAILTIVIMHYLMPFQFIALLNKAILFGGAGVHLFILFSSFGLYLSNKKWLDFYKSRLIKILVPYYIIITIIYILNIFLHFIKDVNLITFLSHIFLFKMFNENFMGSLGYHFWFISTIIQFYLIYPILILLLKRIGFKFFLILSFLLSLSWWLFLAFSGLYKYEIWKCFFLQYLWEFSLGFYLSYLFKEKKFEFWNQNIIIYITLFITGAILLYFVMTKNNPLISTFNDLFSLATYLSAVIIIFKILKFIPFLLKVFLAISTFSYSLYLIHVLPQQLFYFFIKNNNVIIIVPILLGVSLLTAFFYDKLVKFISKIFVTSTNPKS